MFKLQPIPDGHIAAIVTYLEMYRLPAVMPAKPLPGLSLDRVHEPALDWYLPLFRRIGEEWLWFSRLVMRDERLRTILDAPTTALYALREDGRDIGMVELDWSGRPNCEIVFLGLIPEAFGGGRGAWMMRRTQEIAFDEGAERLWLHTCTQDHPSAMPFYLKHGFRAYKRDLETAPDPRLTGDVRADAAAFHPVIKPSRRPK